MQIESEYLDDGVVIIHLSGRMDVAGTNEIDLKFTSLASTQTANVLVDMAQVDFIASIGMRTLISNAKAQAARGGMLVLFACKPLVKDVLETAGIDEIIPIHDELDSALQSCGDVR